MERIRVAVLLGGRSSEHEISCISGRAIVEALDPSRYEVTVIGIRRDGSWVAAADGGLSVLDESGRLPEVSGDVDAVTVDACLQVDVVFPVLHGPWGEDGTVQGLLETMQVPFVGSGTLSAALAMDKGFMKGALQQAGLGAGRYLAVSDRLWREDPDSVLTDIASLGLPVFVKPARAGSSLGISKVSTRDDVAGAIEVARQHDPRVIVEAAVVGAREIECAVLVDEQGVPQASRCAEIVVSADHDFYDYEAKYLDDSATLIVPADLPADLEAQIRDLSVKAFEALACEGLARVDLFLAPQGEIVLNEVNTMPGFTPISMFPRMWQEQGVEYPELVDRLVADALRKGTNLR